MRILDGPVGTQVAEAVRELSRRGALTAHPDPAAPTPDAEQTRDRGTSRIITVLAEPGRQRVSEELLGAAARLGEEVGAAVHALCSAPADAAPWSAVDTARLAAAGADRVIMLHGSAVAEDVADALAASVRETVPWAVLAPSTAFGREVAGRAAAATHSGLVGDAVALSTRAATSWWRRSLRSPAPWWPTSRAAVSRRW